MDLREFTSETTTERESSKLMDAEPMEEESSSAGESSDESEEEAAEETDESEEDSEEECSRVNGPYPQWDVDSFDGLEYNSSEDFNQFSEEEQDKDKLCREFKRQIIESKGFYVDPEINTCSIYSKIKVIRNLDKPAAFGQTFREYFTEMACLCLERYNKENREKNGFDVEFVEVVRGHYRYGERSKSYITFKAKEKPDGAHVEYQAKAWCSYNEGENYPILCRPAPPMAKPSDQNSVV